MIENDLTEKEKEKAKNNGFILVGKRNSGKTNILNVLFDKDVRLIEKSQRIVDNDLIIYFYKLKNGECICLIDTIGFIYEFENKNNDDIKKIISILTAENIHIKSIFFLINFQKERIDLVEGNVLLNYNMLFPSKMFWNNLIIIFTHYYSELKGEDKEKIKERLENSNEKFFNNLMDKIKGVSGIINYNELNIKYYNTNWPIKNEQMKNENIKIKNELEYILSNLIEKEPLYTQIEIIEVKNYQLHDSKIDKQYLFDIEIIGYFDLTNKPLKEYTRIISKKEIINNNNKNLPEFKFNIKILNATINDKDNDNLEFNNLIANENNSNYYKYFYITNKNKEKENILYLIHYN